MTTGEGDMETNLVGPLSLTEEKRALKSAAREKVSTTGREKREHKNAVWGC
jgi:hypothetical protein